MSKGLKVNVSVKDLENVKKAFVVANNAIYFSDSADYLSALYEVCGLLLSKDSCYIGEIGKRFIDIY